MVFIPVDTDAGLQAYRQLWEQMLGGGAAGQRAFCPGASPPDNSCSPSNKGDGRPSAVAATPQVKAWAKRKFANPEHAKAFVEWFGDSKAVDENGEPLVVYHGTNAEFDEFDPSKIGSENAIPADSIGFFFSDSTGVAQQYGNSVGEYYLALRRPYVEDFGGSVYFGKTKNGTPLTEIAASGKYDGIIIKNAIDTGREPTNVLAAFKPTQIKSATKNSGTFDSKNPKVTRSDRSLSRRSARAFCPGASPPDNSCSPSNKGDAAQREQSLAKKHDLSPKQAKWALAMIDKLRGRFSGPGKAAAVNEVLTAAKYPEYLRGILSEVPSASEIESVVAWSVRRGRMWEPKR